MEMQDLKRELQKFKKREFGENDEGSDEEADASEEERETIQAKKTQPKKFSDVGTSKQEDHKYDRTKVTCY